MILFTLSSLILFEHFAAPVCVSTAISLAVQTHCLLFVFFALLRIVIVLPTSPTYSDSSTYCSNMSIFPTAETSERSSLKWPHPVTHMLKVYHSGNSLSKVRHIELLSFFFPSQNHVGVLASQTLAISQNESAQQWHFTYHSLLTYDPSGKQFTLLKFWSYISRFFLLQTFQPHVFPWKSDLFVSQLTSTQNTSLLSSLTDSNRLTDYNSSFYFQISYPISLSYSCSNAISHLQPIHIILDPFHSRHLDLS